MRKISMLMVTIGLICCAPALLPAQVCGPGQCMVEPGLRKNMGMMSAIVDEMHQMLQSGKLNSEQQKNILEMMNQMSGIMQNMGSSEGPQKEAQVQQQLQQLEGKLQDLKAQISKK